MTSPVLPAERFPLAIHFEVLRRFMSHSRNGVEPVTAESVEGGDLPSGAAQQNVAFLSDAGLLVEEAAGKFKPTPVAMQFLNTKAADEQRARKVLRSLLAKSWFARAAEAFQSTHSAAGSDELAAALAEEAHVSSAPDKRAIDVLVEYLTYVGIVSIESRAFPSSSRSSPRNAPTARTRRPVLATGSEAGTRTGSAGWKEMRTDDFELRIRSDREAVRRLRRHLDILEEELTEMTVGRSSE